MLQGGQLPLAPTPELPNHDEPHPHTGYPNLFSHMLLLEGVLSQKKQLRYSPWPAVLQKSSLLELSTMSQWCQTKLQVLYSWTLITQLSLAR